MSSPVVITGMGCISGLGIGLEETWAVALRGDGAIRPFRLNAKPGSPGCSLEGYAARIDPEICRKKLPGRHHQSVDPLSAYALIAANEAVTQAGLVGDGALANRTAVIVGCGSGGNATMDGAYERLYGRHLTKVHPQTIPSSMISAPASHIAMALGIHGPTFVVSSACASSAHALGEAMHMIRSGRVDVVLAGGSEACLTPGSWVAWNSLGVFARDTCRPFSTDRSGMVLGEGATMLVLESEKHARNRKAKVFGELRGYGASSDAVDITAPDQAGIEIAMREAHADAGVAIADPALISSHGTGTRLNDMVEAAALHAVYGRSLANKTVIATKSAHGHLIGATAALEFVIGMKALAEATAPPVLNYLGPDPVCELPLALAPKALDTDTLISNTFAFGGLNAVLIGRCRP